MTLDEIAERLPRLYHVTRPEVERRLPSLGLRTAADALRAVGRDSELGDRRPRAVALPDGTVLSDNAPLSESKLRSCLDDGLTPRDWLCMLNERVFFWAREENVDKLRAAKAGKGEPHVVLVFDTQRLLASVFDRTDLSPINTGATLHAPARRGLATFAPARSIDYAAWRWQRGTKQPDRIVEVSVRGGVPSAAAALSAVLR